MIPRRITNATHKLGAPQNWDAHQHGKCVDLWVRERSDGVFETAWEPTPAELATLNAGGSVVLRVAGGQPAVAIDVEL